MTKTLNSALIALAICGSVLLPGCFGSHGTSTSTDTTSPTTDVARTSSVTYLCVGMETSARFGACSGAGLDATRMNAFLKERYGYGGTFLVSGQATKDAVVKALQTGIAATPADGLFIFFYSGHGGQEDFSQSGIQTSEPEGADSMDEYLCLSDTYMLDDEVWSLISSCKGRVFLIFDCCHSATMWRSVTEKVAPKGSAQALSARMVKSTGFVLKPHARALDTRSTFNMLSWSGCEEKTYSYGSANGGEMTTAILKYWNATRTYDELWPLVVQKVESDQPTQRPVRTVLGTGFNGPAFR